MPCQQLWAEITDTSDGLREEFTNLIFDNPLKRNNFYEIHETFPFSEAHSSFQGNCNQGMWTQWCLGADDLSDNRSRKVPSYNLAS